MKDNNSALTWLQSWLQCQNKNEPNNPCEVEIQTVGELGWSVTIYLTSATYRSMMIPIVSEEYSDDDWYCYRMYNGKYEASGDPGKLEFLLEQFKFILQQVVMCE